MTRIYDESEETGIIDTQYFAADDDIGDDADSVDNSDVVVNTDVNHMHLRGIFIAVGVVAITVCIAAGVYIGQLNQAKNDYASAYTSMVSAVAAYDKAEKAHSDAVAQSDKYLGENNEITAKAVSVSSDDFDNKRDGYRAQTDSWSLWATKDLTENVKALGAAALDKAGKLESDTISINQKTLNKRIANGRAALSTVIEDGKAAMSNSGIDVRLKDSFRHVYDWIGSLKDVNAYNDPDELEKLAQTGKGYIAILNSDNNAAKANENNNPNMKTLNELSSSNSSANNSADTGDKRKFVAVSCTSEGSYNCQDVVDRGELTDIEFYGGASRVFAQHNYDGGEWINDLKPGDRITINGEQFEVNGFSQTGAIDVPTSGTYAQTCDENGNHLVGLTPVG